jgi:flavin reductase (DIM6/NTAB) family NADH-FMN oxidoreductase RutF
MIINMKYLFLSLLIISVLSCSNADKQTPQTASETATVTNAISYEGVKEKSFDQLFKEIKPNEIDDNFIGLVQKDFIVITAGREDYYNSMVAGDGGFGVLMGKPATFCGLRHTRYTLEVILKDSVYTMSFFDEQFRDGFMIFGQKSGRDSEKMKETTLAAVTTPSGKVTFKEAKLVIECKLAQTHTVNPDEVYSDYNRKFFEDAYKEVGGYHKIVFGDITGVWVRK